ncbi:hypothetical protein TNCV_3890991 [Trichonephila clavipes]|nr:hypothetical protein TNCV_3890991 [Trichonephila clavipes]
MTRWTGPMTCWTGQMTCWTGPMKYLVRGPLHSNLGDDSQVLGDSAPVESAQVTVGRDTGICAGDCGTWDTGICTGSDTCRICIGSGRIWEHLDYAQVESAQVESAQVTVGLVTLESAQVVQGYVETVQVALGHGTLESAKVIKGQVESAQVLGHLESAQALGHLESSQVVVESGGGCGTCGICTGGCKTSGICTGGCGICTGAIGSSDLLDTRLMTGVMRTLNHFLEKGRDFSSKGRFSSGK